MEQKTFIYTVEKNIFAAATFEGLWSEQIKKLEVHFGLCESSFTFTEKKRPNKYCLC